MGLAVLAFLCSLVVRLYPQSTSLGLDLAPLLVSIPALSQDRLGSAINVMESIDLHLTLAYLPYRRCPYISCTACSFPGLMLRGVGVRETEEMSFFCTDTTVGSQDIPTSAV